MEQVSAVDRIEVLESGHVQVRTAIRFMENGKQIGGNFHRHIVAPGDDYSREDARVRAICAAMHTPEVVAAYRAALARQ